MRPNPALRPALAGLLLPALVACAGSGASTAAHTSPDPPRVPPLEETVWVAVAIAGEPVIDTPPALVLAPDGTVSGFAGVNRMTGSYTATSAGRLRFGPLALTRMAGPPERMALEAAFADALARVDAYRYDDAALVLLGGESERLRLVAGDAGDLR